MIDIDSFQLSNKNYDIKTKNTTINTEMKHIELLFEYVLELLKTSWDNFYIQEYKPSKNIFTFKFDKNKYIELSNKNVFTIDNVTYDLPPNMPFFHMKYGIHNIIFNTVKRKFQYFENTKIETDDPVWFTMYTFYNSLNESKLYIKYKKNSFVIKLFCYN